MSAADVEACTSADEPCAAATFTRLSLICFYYRLVKDSGIRWFVWVLHASVIWQIALCITFVCLTVWLCK